MTTGVIRIGEYIFPPSPEPEKGFKKGIVVAKVDDTARPRIFNFEFSKEPEVKKPDIVDGLISSTR